MTTDELKWLLETAKTVESVVERRRGRIVEGAFDTCPLFLRLSTSLQRWTIFWGPANTRKSSHSGTVGVPSRNCNTTSWIGFRTPS
jgi:hypothetical protein